MGRRQRINSRRVSIVKLLFVRVVFVDHRNLPGRWGTKPSPFCVAIELDPAAEKNLFSGLPLLNEE
jgi:hypothetical protein